MKKVCKRCNNLREHIAHGFCASCYLGEKYRKNKEHRNYFLNYYRKKYMTDINFRKKTYKKNTIYRQKNIKKIRIYNKLYKRKYKIPKIPRHYKNPFKQYLYKPFGV